MRYVTSETMRCLDDRAIKKYGIPSILLMENAGSACAREARKFQLRNVLVLSGKGNNGGDGFVAARHLHSQGISVSVFFFQHPNKMKADPRVNFKILKNIGLRPVDCSRSVNWDLLRTQLRRSDLVIDALFGTGLSKPVDGPISEVIELVNASKKRVLSVDIPSGLNADTGEVMGAAIKAGVTVTLGLPKKGFLAECAKPYLGRVVVADISHPCLSARTALH